jgi:hypothetical protein
MRRNQELAALACLAVIAMTAVTVASCADSVEPKPVMMGAIALHTGGPLLTDCDYETVDCAEIQSGLDALWDSGNADCRSYALDAADFLYHSADGKVPEGDDAASAWTSTIPVDSSNVEYTGLVYINPLDGLAPSQIAGLLAHEASHIESGDLYEQHAIDDGLFCASISTQ